MMMMMMTWWCFFLSLAVFVDTCAGFPDYLIFQFRGWFRASVDFGALSSTDPKQQSEENLRFQFLTVLDETNAKLPRGCSICSCCSLTCGCVDHGMAKSAKSCIFLASFFTPCSDPSLLKAWWRWPWSFSWRWPRQRGGSSRTCSCHRRRSPMDLLNFTLPQNLRNRPESHGTSRDPLEDFRLSLLGPKGPIFRGYDMFQGVMWCFDMFCILFLMTFPCLWVASSVWEDKIMISSRTENDRPDQTFTGLQLLNQLHLHNSNCLCLFFLFFVQQSWF